MKFTIVYLRVHQLADLPLSPACRQAGIRPCFHQHFPMRPAGLEPTTYWSEASRSIQLSYGRMGKCR